MDKTKELAVQFIESIYIDFFIHKKSDMIMDNCIACDVPLIGLKTPDWEYEYELISKYSHIDELSENLYFISTRLTLGDARTKKELGHSRVEYEVKNLIDCTLTCRQVKDGSFKICNLHFSRMEDFKYSEFNQQADKQDPVYLKVLENTYDIVIEYDVISNVFTYDVGKYYEHFGVNTHFVSADQWFWHMCTESVHVQDTEALDMFRSNDILKRIKNKDYVVEREIRIRKKGQTEYTWMKMTTFFMPNEKQTNLSKIFVLFKNIDEEKRKDLDYITKSRTDSLTGLSNRDYTKTQIEEFLNEDEKNDGIFIILDIDEFKKVNDTFGHLTGDELLKLTAKGLRESVDENDVVGRIGGDEFVIFLKNIHDEKIAKSKMTDILNSVRQDYSEGMDCLSVGCSAGAVLTNGVKDIQRIYKRADSYLYESKRTGRNTFRITSM